MSAQQVGPRRAGLLLLLAVSLTALLVAVHLAGQASASSLPKGRRRALLGSGASAAAEREPCPPPSVALCLLARDEWPEDLDEWLQHYKRLGVSKVYLYDNNSSTPLFASPAVMRHIRRGFLQYRQFERWLHPKLREERYRQTAIYNQCLEDYGRRHDWMGFFDLDEFVILRGEAAGMDLPSFLTDFQPFGGLCVNWRLFGSSGHVNRPAGGVLANYWKCQPEGHSDGMLCKMLVQARRTPRHVAEAGTHAAAYAGASPAIGVNEDFDQVGSGAVERWAGGRIVLHHYVTKSRRVTLRRLGRGGAAARRRPAPARLRRPPPLHLPRAAHALAWEDFAAKHQRGSVMGNPAKDWPFFFFNDTATTEIYTDGLAQAANQTAAQLTWGLIGKELRLRKQGAR
eukprot:scaffold6.g2865.t1